MRERISNIKGSPQLIFPLKIFNEPVYGSYILLAEGAAYEHNYGL